MATTKQVVGGLEILGRYGGADDHNICAEHDIIYAGHGCVVSDDDRAKLEELGWHWDDDIDSWARFV